MSVAVRRVIQVVELAAKSAGGVAAVELASSLGISRQAATRLLSSLASAGILRREPSGKRYVLTLKLYEWVGQDVRRRFPASIIRREIAKLASRIEHRVDFVVLEGDSIVLLERTEWQDGLLSTVPQPARAPWSNTATGKVIVAFSPPPLVEQLLPNRGREAPTTSNTSNLRAELQTIRIDGYAEAELSPGRLGLATAIIDASGFAIGAIGIPLIEREEPPNSLRRYIDPLKDAAARCAEQLGHAVPVSVA